jgi:MFS family permease
MTQPSTPMYCANHPNVETTLRCNRCEKPICPKCAISTPTGYRCKECVKGQQKTFETAKVQDFVLGGSVAAILALLGSFIVPRLGFFTIILSPVAGVIIAEVVRAIIQKRRSKRLYQIIVGSIILGCLPLLLSALVTTFFFLSNGNLSALWAVLLQGIYTFMVATTAYYRLSGIQLNV